MPTMRLNLIPSRALLTLLILRALWGCGSSTLEKEDFDLPPLPFKSGSDQSKASNTVGLFSECIISQGAFPVSSPELAPPPYYGSSGQTVQLTHRRVESKKDLRDTLKRVAQGGGEGTQWQIMGKLESLKDLTISQDSRWYFYMIEVKNPVMMLKGVQLSPGAYQLFRRKGLNAFYKRCGKTVTTGYQTGGSLLHIIRISKKFQESQQSLDHLISASGFGFNARGMVEVDDEADFSELDVDIHTKMQGGRGEAAYTTLKNLRRMSEEWPQAVAKHGVLLRTITTPFSQLIHSLHAPGLKRVIQETRHYHRALDRLTALKARLLHPQMGQLIESRLQYLSRLQQLIAKLTRKVEICERSGAMKNCQDMELILEASSYKISVEAAHPSCGVLSRREQLTRHPHCGEETYYENVVQQDPRCPAKNYKTGTIFQQQITLQGTQNNARRLNDAYPQRCNAADAQRVATLLKTEHKNHRPPCSPRNDECLFESKTIKMPYFTYNLQCRAPRKRFGVQSYSSCAVTLARKRFKQCLRPTDEAKEYHRCRVPLEHVPLPEESTAHVHHYSN